MGHANYRTIWLYYRSRSLDIGQYRSVSLIHLFDHGEFDYDLENDLESCRSISSKVTKLEKSILSPNTLNITYYRSISPIIAQ